MLYVIIIYLCFVVQLTTVSELSALLYLSLLVSLPSSSFSSLILSVLVFDNIVFICCVCAGDDHNMCCMSLW